jgi:histidine ammonia-lyase
MGTIAARKAGSILDNALTVVAMEILAASQALDLRAKEHGLHDGAGSLLSPPTRAAYRLLRDAIPALEDDRLLYPDIQKARSLVASGELARAAFVPNAT